TIYFGAGTCLFAVNPDGTLKWREYIGGDVESAPAIGSDGTVYIGDGRDDGCLHAFGPLDPNAPSAPDINGPTSGKVGTSYEYTFKSTSPLGRDIYYYVDWGDNTVTDWNIHIWTNFGC
ncbi:MAG: PQQ-binding-like beta-propeller repeat protein, partial [Thermoplasmatota archaeon]